MLMQTLHKALIAPINKNGQLLLQDRSNIAKLGVTLAWGWFGGEIEGKETSLEAVIRETEEELTIKLDPKQLLHIGNYKDQIFTDLAMISDIYLWEMGDITLDDLVLKEGLAMKFFDLDAAKKLLPFEGSKRAIDEIKSRIN